MTLKVICNFTDDKQLRRGRTPPKYGATLARTSGRYMIVIGLVALAMNRVWYREWSYDSVCVLANGAFVHCLKAPDNVVDWLFPTPQTWMNTVQIEILSRYSSYIFVTAALGVNAHSMKKFFWGFYDRVGEHK